MTRKAVELEFTRHAVHVMRQREIAAEWVERVVQEPTVRTPDSNDPELERFFRPIPERAGRALRVVVNTRKTPWRVVSVFFDRNARMEP